MSARIPLSLCVALVAALSAGEALAVRCPNDLPVLFIVQDKSGSMDEKPTKTCTDCPSMWASARSSITSLTSRYASSFRFGLMMYPRDAETFNCTTGTVLSPVPSTTAQIAAAYASKTPGGGTPTSFSLTAAKDYLLGLRLPVNEPASVLLLTDGLPNCNTALNYTSCTRVYPDDYTHNIYKAKNCLDDAASRAAAAALKAAGIKTYVIGFGDQATGVVNKAVLDGIASAGGTGTAYAANNEAALVTALDTIANHAAGCCKDACSGGASECLSATQQRRCALDAASGCYNWTTATCPTKSSCSGGTCVPCSDQCTLNAGRCVNDSAQKCVVGTYGCTEWREVDRCAYGETCKSGVCQSCATCTAGQKRCNNNDVETCERDLVTGCTNWYRSTCASGTVCESGLCQRCDGTCSAGSKQCSGKTPQTCMADSFGCTAWKSGSPCTYYCTGGVCGTCGTSCTPGQTRCNGDSVETCTTDPNGCPVWTSSGPCGAGKYCSAGTCVACATSCTLGSRRCSGTQVETCERDTATACTVWKKSACASGSVCSAGYCQRCDGTCTVGAKSCNGAVPQTCEADANGCTSWKAGTRCTDYCSGGNCGFCGPSCTAGASRCNGDTVETCGTDAKGCSIWNTVGPCAANQYCSAGKCVACGTVCTLGTRRCNGTAVETCERDPATACTVWTRSACASGSVCQAGHCEPCDGTCTIDAKHCVGAVPQACVADANGCTSWKSGVRCQYFCTGGACGTCGTSCTAGESRCNGSSIETCGTDSTGCPSWLSRGPCLAGQYCTQGRCVACATSCELGTRRCAGLNIEECRAGAQGCREWTPVGTCLDGERCDQGVCIPPCNDECETGARRCDAQGRPQRCEGAPNGCRVWGRAADCAEGLMCADGDCFEPCIPGEFETCKPGYVCTSTPQGRVCKPAAPVEGPDAGSDSPIVIPDDDPKPGQGGNETVETMATGCGCAAASGATGVAWLLGALAAAALRRRR